MLVIDTNVFLYAAIKESRDHALARKMIEEWRSSVAPWHSTWGIFYEFLRVSTHPAVFEHPLAPLDAWKFLKAILAAPGFSLLPEQEDHSQFIEKFLLEPLEVRGNLWHDGHTAALMHEHGIRTIVTADTDFHRFKGLRVNNPFA